MYIHISCSKGVSRPAQVEAALAAAAAHAKTRVLMLLRGRGGGRGREGEGEGERERERGRGCGRATWKSINSDLMKPFLFQHREPYDCTTY